ncbi:Dom-3 Z [Physocladia obscura]|uniref:Decapping nuclease n=1 Tax=Physocladia obscura TaxID=109957 RepID=A0AAD5XDU7_9FUNG|nr:Dom-3 Z [Physocladia obscura]
MKRVRHNNEQNEQQQHHQHQHQQISSLGRIKVAPIARYKRACAAFRKPEQITRFAYNNKRQLILDNTAATVTQNISVEEKSTSIDNTANKEQPLDCTVSVKLFRAPDSLPCRKQVLLAVSTAVPRVKDLNLSSGYPDRYIAREDGVENLNSLITALNHSDKSILNPPLPKNSQPAITTMRPRVCTWRGIMTKILVAPYAAADNSWQLLATLHNGTLYIMEDPQSKKEPDPFSQSYRGKLMTYWGYRFESLVTIDDPADVTSGKQTQPLPNEAVINTNVQFCSVVKTRIGACDLLLGAEVDCTFNEPPTDPSFQLPQEQPTKYAELKTNRDLTIGNPHKRANQSKTFHAAKLLKTYFQCFLAGIPKIIIGWRDDDGFLTGYSVLDTLRVPRIARDYFETVNSSNDQRASSQFTKASANTECWDPTVCINWADDVLTMLWTTIEKRNKDILLQNDNDVDTNEIVYRVRMRGVAVPNTYDRDNNRGIVNEDGYIEILDPVIGGENVFVGK